MLPVLHMYAYGMHHKSSQASCRQLTQESSRQNIITQAVKNVHAYRLGTCATAATTDQG